MEELFNFEYLRENNYLLYEYVRGSTLYGINREGSDIDKIREVYLLNLCLLS